jgi:hypothetical protein
MSNIQALGKSILDKIGTWEDESFFKYLLSVGPFIFIGTVFGTLLDGGVDAVQEQVGGYTWWVCLIYLLIQLYFSVAVYWFLNWFFKGSVKSWLFSTSAGFMFSLLYFGVQNNLMINIRKTFAFLPQQQTQN